jgi:hypothetical protein
MSDTPEQEAINNSIYWLKKRVDLLEAQLYAARYRRVREFLQRGDGVLDTRGLDDAAFDKLVDSLKEENSSVVVFKQTKSGYAVKITGGGGSDNPDDGGGKGGGGKGGGGG